MKKLLSYVILAISVIGGYRKTIIALKAENERLSKIIEEEDFDDAEREAKLAELESAEAEAAEKADELARLLNDEPAVPTVDPETFDVTEGATVPPQDLAIREHQAETAGKAEPAPQGPVGPAGAQGSSGDAGGEGEGAGEVETAEDLVSTNSRESLIALADKEGAEYKNGDNMDTIAAAIIAKREEGAK
jgi:hypothetical protein